MPSARWQVHLCDRLDAVERSECTGDDEFCPEPPPDWKNPKQRVSAKPSEREEEKRLGTMALLTLADSLEVEWPLGHD